MNLIKEYKKMNFNERQELIKLIKEDFKRSQLLEKFITKPKFEVKEKSVKTD